MTVVTVNPATGETLPAYDESGHDEIDWILDAARDAAAKWRGTPVPERAQALRRLPPHRGSTRSASLTATQ